MTPQRQEISRPQHLDWDAKKRARRVDGNDLREKQVAFISWSRHSGCMRDGLDGAGGLSLMI